MRHFRVLISGLVLAAAVGWGIHASAPAKSIHASTRPHPTKPTTSMVEPKLPGDIGVNLVAPAPQSEPLPQPQPEPVPAPQPEATQWQGDPEPVAASPSQIPVLLRVPTDKPVVFLGIDDGLVKSPEAYDWLTSHHLQFTLFLEDDLVRSDYDYFRGLQAAGMTIEDHTISHPDLTTMTLDQQKAEICGAADSFQAAFGSRPTLFRPPYGSYNDLTRQAAAECGMKALIIWHAKANGGAIQFQDGNTSLLPGDIVLMHFRPEFLQDMKAFTDQASAAGLQIGRLEDWIQ